jgi:hypothetical protein
VVAIAAQVLEKQEALQTLIDEGTVSVWGNLEPSFEIAIAPQFAAAIVQDSQLHPWTCDRFPLPVSANNFPTGVDPVIWGVSDLRIEASDRIEGAIAPTLFGVDNLAANLLELVQPSKLPYSTALIQVAQS